MKIKLDQLPRLLREYRIASHESQEAFGKRFGVTATAVSLWENGQREMPNAVLLSILGPQMPMFKICDKCQGAGMIRKEDYATTTNL